MVDRYNFSAGPAVLPKEVLRQVQQEFSDWKGIGSSIVEISHRSKDFTEMADESIADLKELLAIPDNYRVLFAHGGARGQFAAVAMNLMRTGKADYIDSGYWSHCAADEAEKYGEVKRINVVEKDALGRKKIRPMSQWALSDDADYLYLCANETLDGLELKEEPIWQDKIVVADMSSDILSKPIDVSRYGMIFAGAQKNVGPAGLTIIIIREDLIGEPHPLTPAIFDYRILDKYESMFNTPATFPWYVAGLVFKWLKSQGGLVEITKRNEEKAALLYHTIDNSDGFYRNMIVPENRSLMNVSFLLPDESLNGEFITKAKAQGLTDLKGHRLTGGLRASIYNAMPLEGVETLVAFMQAFADNHRGDKK